MGQSEGTNNTTIEVKLNEVQKEAVEYINGPLLIIAGPGSGKTKTLVERTINLIRQGVKPEQIFISTFTEKAAKELVTRMSLYLHQQGLNTNLHEMYIGTLHSLFLRILEEYREYSRIKRNYRILDDFEQTYFVYLNINKYLKLPNISSLFQNNFNSWQKAKILVTHINKIAEECLEPNTLISAIEHEIQALGYLVSEYSKMLNEENCLDFAGIQKELLYLLNNRPEILLLLQEKLKYFMVDEYQDTNTIQEKILLLLSAKYNNLCVVGDDDQGLYRFRGATVRNILEFPNNYSEGTCKQIYLVTNYRSHPEIINFCQNWINSIDWEYGEDKYRFSKNITPAHVDFPATSAVVKIGNNHGLEQYFDEIYNFISTLKNSGSIKNYNQIAFLFRSVKNDRVIALTNYLENRGINVFSPRSALFFERVEIRLAIGALVFLFPNLFNQLKWTENAHLPVWEYYERCKADFAIHLRANEFKHKELLGWARSRAKEHLTMSKNTNYAFAALLYQMLEFPLFSEHLTVDLDDNATSLRAAYNLALLSKILYKFEFLYDVSIFTPKNLETVLRNLFNNYLRFLIDGGIEEYEDYDSYSLSGCVSIMTIHQSKGLEFPIVIIGSLGNVPRKDHSEIDAILQSKYYSKPPFEPIDKIKYFDFYRLYYTAFSRAQNLLVLTANEVTEGRHKEPSKYFQELYNQTIDWKDGGFNYRLINFAKINPVKIKNEYSFTSHILLYENCPLQYKYYKELEFVEVRTGGVLGGSVLHQTIEDIHRAVLRDEIYKLTDDNIQKWFYRNYTLLAKQQRAQLHKAQIQSLLEQVLRYRDRNSNSWDKIKEAEVDVSLVKPNYVINGTIDLIKGENGSVELIDFKSGDKPDINSTDTYTVKILSQYRRQLEVYAHLVEQRTGHKVTKLHLYYTKEDQGNPYISFTANQQNVESTINGFEKVVNKIEQKKYDMSNTIKSEKQCGNCDMRYHCNPRHYTKI